MPMNNKLHQTAKGRTWEYALAQGLADALRLAPAIQEQLKASAQHTAYQSLPTDAQESLRQAVQAAVPFLLQHDPELAQAKRILFQDKSAAQDGDVRDILVQTSQGPIGLIAKYRHSAIRHSRLSGTINFGKDWYGAPCSEQYWKSVRPVFGDLRQLQQQGKLWKDMKGEAYRLEVCQTVLTAFIREVKKHVRPKHMMRYLLGRHNFYKIIKTNGHVKLESFNLSGSLRWGDRLRLPTQLIGAVAKPRAKSTALISFDNGWALSMRLHTASSKIEPSLKFDVQLADAPPSLSQHQIPLG